MKMLQTPTMSLYIYGDYQIGSCHNFSIIYNVMHIFLTNLWEWKILNDSLLKLPKTKIHHP